MTGEQMMQQLRECYRQYDEQANAVNKKSSPL